MGEYADMALEELELESFPYPRRRPFRSRLMSWLEHRHRKWLAKRLAALTGFSAPVVYLVLIGSHDDLAVARQALEHAVLTNTRPEPGKADAAPWEPTLAWEQVRLLAEARGVVLRGAKRLLG